MNRQPPSQPSKKKASWFEWLTKDEPAHQKSATERAERTLANVSARLAAFNDAKRSSNSDLLWSISEVRTQSVSQSFSIPFPDQIESRHQVMLAAAYRKRKLQQIQSAYVETLSQAEGQLRAYIRQKKEAEGLLNRIFNRADAEAKIDNACRHLSEICDSESIVSAYKKTKLSLSALQGPLDLTKLKQNYRKNYADYAAVLEKAADLESAETQSRARENATDLRTAGVLPTASRKRTQSGTKSNASQPFPTPVNAIRRGRQGGLPVQIAAEVEAVSLNIDNLNVNLRAYQEFGIKYLIHQRRTILGDEMGLGKTIQALGAIAHSMAEENAYRFLVVAPASILGNWEREISNRMPGVAVRLLHGSDRDQRTRLWKAGGGIGLTSYATLRSLTGHEQFAPDIMIVDEAHKVKNPEAMRSIAVAKVAQNSKRLVLMSGTPLENHVGEFVNLIRMCDPTLAAKVSVDNGGVEPSVFERQVASTYLRRNQVDVLTELPDVVETEEWIDFGPSDWRYYDTAIGSGIMKLRQAANGFSSAGAKMSRLKELVDHYRDARKKVVIFSFFKDSLSMAGEIIGQHYRIDGSVTPNRRMQIIDEFSESNQWQALISQIDAGGVGLNIQAASVVILIEPQFKPTTEWQAIKRVHRMGQTERVKVHRLLASDTVDERLRQLVGQKADVFDAYARESAIKNSSTAAADASVKEKIMELEMERYQKRQRAG